MTGGTLVAVVGPSGAGKDTLIGAAEAALGGRAPFLFVRRLVTREANPFEDHDTIDEAAFSAGEAAGAFALCWRAHGLGYAIPASVGVAVEGGAVAVCNLSRRIVPDARRRFPACRVVEITAPMPVLAARQASRGRETMAAIEARLAREVDWCEPIRPDLRIVNDRALAMTSGELIGYLRGLAGVEARVKQAP